MTVKWRFDGGDATQGLEFFTSTVAGGTIATSTTQARTGPRSVKCANSAGGAGSYGTKTGILAQAGGRVTVALYFESLNSAVVRIIGTANAAATKETCSVQLSAANALQFVVFDTTNARTVNGTGSTLVAGQWYRITFCWSITSTTVNEFRVYLNGVLDITQSNLNLATSNIACDQLQLGYIESSGLGASKVVYVDDVYVDDLTTLTDTGDVHVTNKRPIANGSLNEFTTQIGVGGSGTGTGHSPQVNEQPLSTTNGWSFQNVAKKTEEYSVQGAAAGDVDISNATIVDWAGWVYAKVGVNSTGNIIVGGVATNISVTTAYGMFVQSSGLTSIPAGSTDVGIDTNTVNQLFSLAECGVLVAYTTTQLEWMPPLSEPVRAPPSAVLEGLYIIDSITPPDAAADTSSEWMQPLSEPVRIPRAVDIGAFELNDLGGTLQEDTELEWWANANEPVRQPPTPVGEGAFELANREGLQEDTFLEWLPQTSEPVRLPPRAVDEGAFELANREGLQEDTFLEWLPPTAEPVRTPSRAVDEGFVVNDLTLIVPDVSIEWLPPTSEPVRVAPSPIGEGFLIIGNLDNLQEDTFLEWWQNANEPQRAAARPVEEGFFVADPTLHGAQEDTFLEWLPQLSEPVRIPGRMVDEGLFLIDFSALAQPTDTFLSWWRQTDEPVRTPAYRVSEGFFIIGDLGIPIPAQVMRAGGWYDVRPVGGLVRGADPGVRPA